MKNQNKSTIKKIFSFGLVSVIIIFLVACSEYEVQNNDIVYSYSGENELFSISDGIIFLSEEEDIIYGGDLKAKDDQQFTEIVSENMKLYVLSDGVEIPLTSFYVSSNTSFSLGNPGSITTQISNEEKENLLENLYFKLSIETSTGEKNDYDIKMNVTDITEGFQTDSNFYR